MIRLVSALATEFHRDLATQGWLEGLRACVEERIGTYRSDYHSADVTSVVRSRYNEVRYMGPNSVVKYHFIVEATLPRHDAPTDPDRFESSIRYNAETGIFETLHEVFDSKEIRARREVERCGAQRTRLLTQLMALHKLECEMEKFVSQSNQSDEQAGKESRVEASIWKRFPHAALRSCLSCGQAAPSTAYVVERSWSIIWVHRNERRFVSLCQGCVGSDLLRVGHTLRRFWKALPETRSSLQSEPSQEHRIEIDDGEWDTWSIAANGVRAAPGSAPCARPMRLT